MRCDRSGTNSTRLEVIGMARYLPEMPVDRVPKSFPNKHLLACHEQKLGNELSGLSIQIRWVETKAWILAAYRLKTIEYIKEAHD